MKKWEYNVVVRECKPELDSDGRSTFPSKNYQWDKSIEDMNKYGLAGWELVQIRFCAFRDSIGGGYLTDFYTQEWYFKRQIE